jgi:hypothetical protein
MNKNFGLIAAIFFIGYGAYYLMKVKEAHQQAKFTIGYVKGEHLSLKSGKQIDYIFYVKGKQYKDGDDYQAGMDIVQGRYLVKFDSISPVWNGIYFEVPIPDSIKDAPEAGWLKPPFVLTKEILTP